MDIKLWTDEYFIDLIERHLKHQVGMYFDVHHERKPTKEEYEDYFDKWKSKIKCSVTNFDLGIYD